MFICSLVTNVWKRIRGDSQVENQRKVTCNIMLGNVISGQPNTDSVLTSRERENSSNGDSVHNK